MLRHWGNKLLKIWGIALNKLLSQREITPFLVILDKVRDREAIPEIYRNCEGS